MRSRLSYVVIVGATLSLVFASSLGRASGQCQTLHSTLSASDASAYDSYGQSVSASGDVAVFGAPGVGVAV